MSGWGNHLVLLHWGVGVSAGRCGGSTPFRRCPRRTPRLAGSCRCRRTTTSWCELVRSGTEPFASPSWTTMSVLTSGGFRRYGSAESRPVRSDRAAGSPPLTRVGRPQPPSWRWHGRRARRVPSHAQRRQPVAAVSGASARLVPIAHMILQTCRGARRVVPRGGCDLRDCVSRDGRVTMHDRRGVPHSRCGPAKEETPDRRRPGDLATNYVPHAEARQDLKPTYF